MTAPAYEPVAECLWCDRNCPRCGYEIPGGFEHIEQPQAPESNAVVCNFRRVVRPMVECLTGYFEHHAEHVALRAVPVANDGGHASGGASDA